MRVPEPTASPPPRWARTPGFALGRSTARISGPVPTPDSVAAPASNPAAARRPAPAPAPKPVPPPALAGLGHPASVRRPACPAHPTPAAARPPARAAAPSRVSPASPGASFRTLTALAALLCAALAPAPLSAQPDPSAPDTPSGSSDDTPAADASNAPDATASGTEPTQTERDETERQPPERLQADRRRGSDTAPRPPSDADRAGDLADGVLPPSVPSPDAGGPLAVLSLGGDAPEGEARRARQAVAAALRASGARVLPDADVVMRISPRRLAACREAACAFRLGRELDADSVAAVTMWMGEAGPGSLGVSLVLAEERSYSAREEIDGDLAEAAARAVEAALAAQERAVLVEGVRRVRPEDEEPTPELDDGRDSPLRAERSLEEWILPSLLGVVGLTLVGLSVYALLEEQCDRRGASGVCLVGTSPNLGLGVTFAITGALSIAGALVWLVVGGQPPTMGEIDVVLGPEGGGLAWRGRF